MRSCVVASRTRPLPPDERLDTSAGRAGGRRDRDRILAGARRAGAGPERVTIDSRDAGPGACSWGCRGASHDGGAFAGQALAAGAWGTLTATAHAQAAIGAAGGRAADAGAASRGAVLAADDPLRALQSLATAWRRRLGAQVIGVTGSTGKTSTKDLLLALLAPHRRTVASRANFNTEIGLPLEILGAPAGTEVLVLEMGMRGVGQIAELASDRRARRRGDREHRAGPPRAPGHRGGRGRGQGGADRGAGSRGHRGRPGGRAAAGSASASGCAGP